MKHLLEVKDRAGDLILSLYWQDGIFIPLYVHDGLESTVDRWTKHGINELVVNRAVIEPRNTESSHPEFLPRLEQYIKRQSGFITTLKISE